MAYFMAAYLFCVSYLFYKCHVPGKLWRLTDVKVKTYRRQF